MAERQIQTGVYNGPGGPSAERSIDRVNYRIREEVLTPPIISVDQLVAEQVRNAIEQNRHSITVLDLGSGEGRLLKDMISRPEFMSETQTALADAQAAGLADFSIRIIGLTDTQGIKNIPSVNGTEYTAQALPFTQGLNYPTTATNYAYAITNSQPLSRFFADHTPNGIDLIIATESLKYLPRHIFTQALDDIASVLTVGGKCVIAGFNTKAEFDLSLEEVGRKRVPDGSLRDLRDRGQAIWIFGSKLANEEVTVYNELLSLWDLLSIQTLERFDQLVDAGKLPELVNAQLEVGDHRTVYERALKGGADISTVISLQELTVYATSLLALIKICDAVLDKDERAKIVHSFVRTHTDLRVVLGDDIFYFLKVA